MADQLTPVLMDPRKAPLSLPPQDPRRALAQAMLDAHQDDPPIKGLPSDWRATLTVACLSAAGNSHSALGRAFGVSATAIKRWMKKRAFAEARAQACEGLRLLLVNPLVSYALKRDPDTITDAKERQQIIDLRLRLLGRLYPTEFGATPHVQVNNTINNEAPAAPTAAPVVPRWTPAQAEKFLRQALTPQRPAIEHSPDPAEPQS